MGRPPTGVLKLVLGGPVKLGGLPTKTCTRTPTLYTTGVVAAILTLLAAVAAIPVG